MEIQSHRGRPKMNEKLIMGTLIFLALVYFSILAWGFVELILWIISK